MNTRKNKHKVQPPKKQKPNRDKFESITSFAAYLAYLWTTGKTKSSTTENVLKFLILMIGLVLIVMVLAFSGNASFIAEVLHKLPISISH